MTAVVVDTDVISFILKGDCRRQKASSFETKLVLGRPSCCGRFRYDGLPDAAAQLNFTADPYAWR